MDKSKRILNLAAFLLFVLALTFAVVYHSQKPVADTGTKNIAVEVTGTDGEASEYEFSTDAETLKQAMDFLSGNGSGFSYSGSDGEYGLMVEEINGERAVYDKDGAYWALYVNGEYGQYGADSQLVADGDRFEWKYEKSK